MRKVQAIHLSMLAPLAIAAGPPICSTSWLRCQRGTLLTAILFCASLRQFFCAPRSAHTQHWARRSSTKRRL
eukprot:166646-Pleurochrysis_carterae.AAC.1